MFWFAVTACVLYQSYRYPLQMNFSGTSPTYSDTPAALQYGKYGMLVLLAAVAAFVSRGARLTRHAMPWAITMSGVAAFPVTKFMFDQDPRHLIFPCVVLTLLALVAAIDRVHISSLARFIRVGLAVSLAVNAIQFALFLTIGRLPALAYEGSLSVRFGSFLDDPNGFGSLLYLFLGYVYVQQPSWRRTGLLAGVLASLLLTQSLTAIAFLLGLVAIVLVRNLFRHPLLIATTLIGALTAASLYGPDLYDLYNKFYELKSGSIEGHLSWISVASLSGLWHWIIGSSEYAPSESWWLGSLANYGLLWSLALLFVGVAFLWRVARRLRATADTESRGVLGGVLVYGIYLMVASANLPFFTVFPNNVLFLVFLFLFLFDKVDISRTGDPSTRTPPATRLRLRLR